MINLNVIFDTFDIYNHYIFRKFLNLSIFSESKDLYLNKKYLFKIFSFYKFDTSKKYSVIKIRNNYITPKNIAILKLYSIEYNKIVIDSYNLKHLIINGYKNIRWINYQNLINLEIKENQYYSQQGNRFSSINYLDFQKIKNLKRLIIKSEFIIASNNILDLSSLQKLNWLNIRCNTKLDTLILPNNLKGLEFSSQYESIIKNLDKNKKLIYLCLYDYFFYLDENTNISYTLPSCLSNLKICKLKLVNNIYGDYSLIKKTFFENLFSLENLYLIFDHNNNYDNIDLSKYKKLKKINLRNLNCKFLETPSIFHNKKLNIILDNCDINTYKLESHPNLLLELIDTNIQKWSTKNPNMVRNVNIKSSKNIDIYINNIPFYFELILNCDTIANSVNTYNCLDKIKILDLHGLSGSHYLEKLVSKTKNLEKITFWFKSNCSVRLFLNNSLTQLNIFYRFNYIKINLGKCEEQTYIFIDYDDNNNFLKVVNVNPETTFEKLLLYRTKYKLIK